MDRITNPVLDESLQGSSGSEFATSTLSRLIGFGFVAGAVIFFFVMLWGAIQWITSGGDKAKVEMARGKLTSAVIGLVILFSLFAVAKVIEWFTHVDIIHLDLGPLLIS